MPTQITQFADAEIKVRYKEPFITAGLDSMLTGIAPKGIHRGFRLTTNGTALTVTVEADAVDSDHVAAYQTADGYTLRLRRTGGDFTLDLSPFVSEQVVIAIFAEYTIGVTTAADIRAYEFDPTDEFTGAAERPELVVLGKVDVPASGVIPEASITPTYRTPAWEHVGTDAAPWEQVIENGSFDIAADTTAFTSADRGFLPHWDVQYLSALHTWVITPTVSAVGYTALQVTGTGVTGTSILPTSRIISARPGQVFRLSYQIRGANWPTIVGGGMGVQLRFYDATLIFLSSGTAQDKTLNGTFGWTQIDEYFEAPTDAAFCIPAIVVEDDPVAGVTSSLFFDDVRVWAAGGAATQPFSSVQDSLVRGGGIFDKLGIAETDLLSFGGPQDLYSFIEGLLQVFKLDVVDGVNRYQWKRLDDDPFAFLLSEGSLQLTGLAASAAEAIIPRISSVFAPSGTSTYTLLWEALHSSGASSGALRVYVTGSNLDSRDAVVVTSNAKWDSASSQWNVDNASTRSSRLDFSTAGVQYWYRQSVAGPWSDANWDDGGTNSRLLLDFDAQSEDRGELLLHQTNIEQTGLTASAAEAIIARLSSVFTTAATSNYTLMWEMVNAGGAALGNLRIYASDANLDGRNAIILTGNAKWTGTQWDLDVPVTHAARFDFSTSGIQFWYRAGVAGPWNDADWDDGGTNSARMLDFDHQSVENMQMILEGGAQLKGPSVDEADGATARIATEFLNASATTSPAWVLIWEHSTKTGTSKKQRLYAADHVTYLASQPALALTMNARFDANPLNKNWVEDEAGDSTMFAMTNQRHSFFIRDASTYPSPWSESDWNNEGQALQSFLTSAGGNPGMAWSYAGARLTPGNEDFANPLKTVSVAGNSLYSKNIVKAWGIVRASVTTPTLIAAFGVASVAYSGTAAIDVTLDNAMDPEQGAGADRDWVALVQVDGNGVWHPIVQTQDDTDFSIWVTNAGTLTKDTDIVGDNYRFVFIVIGER